MKFFLQLLFILSVVVSALSFETHHNHISYSKLTVHNDSVELMIKVNSDDLSVFTKVYSNKSVINENDKISNVLQVFKAFYNNTQLHFQFLKSIKSGDNDIMYFVAKGKYNDCNFSVSNELCCNVFVNQKNLCLVSCNSIEKSFVLDCKNKTCAVK